MLREGDDYYVINTIFTLGLFLIYPRKSLADDGTIRIDLELKGILR